MSQKGQGFLNISQGITNIMGGLFGSNGAADEIGALTGKSGGYYPSDTVTTTATATRNNTLFIVLLLAGVVALFFFLKK